MPQDFVQEYGKKEPYADGYPSKYDIVLITGPNINNSKRKKKLEESGLYVCLIGDGKKDGTLTDGILQETLTGKIDHNTHILINAHGFAIKNEKGSYGSHTLRLNTQIRTTTENNLKLLSDIYTNTLKGDSDIALPMAVSLISCQAGVAKKTVPQNIALTCYGGQKYSTGSAMLNEYCTQKIKYLTSGVTDSAEHFMHSITELPETQIYSRHLDEPQEAKTFKACAPKQPLKTDLELYLRNQLKSFLEFRREELGDDVGDIDQKAKKFTISQETLTRYNEKALILESGRSNSKNQLQYVKDYLKKGVNPDAELEGGGTALMYASNAGHVDVVAALIEAGASVDLSDHRDCTALILVSHTGHKDIAATLIEAGASVDLNTRSGHTALMHASYAGHKDIVAMLLEADASVDLVANNGNTALKLASQTGHDEIVDFLTQKLAEREQTQAPAASAGDQMDITDRSKRGGGEDGTQNKKRKLYGDFTAAQVNSSSPQDENKGYSI